MGSQGNHRSLEDPNIDQSGGSQSSMSGVITPRGRRDPSPAELGLLKARSIEPQVSAHCITTVTLHDVGMQISAGQDSNCAAMHHSATLQRLPDKYTVAAQQQ